MALYGYRLGLLDTPNARSSHRTPVPKGGGLGILIAFVVTALWWGLPSSLWIPALFLALASFWGDFRDVSFQIRLAVQFGCAAVFSSFRFFGNPMSDISEPLKWGAVLFGALIITATANCFNFMDGINGLAGLTGAIAFSCLGLFGMMEGKESIWSISAFGISAACLGFLPLNMPRARVFMGDVGSILLGFLFASWSLWLARSLHEFVALFLFLFPFYLDELDTIIARIREKRKAEQGSPAPYLPNFGQSSGNFSCPRDSFLWIGSSCGHSVGLADRQEEFANANKPLYFSDGFFTLGLQIY